MLNNDVLELVERLITLENEIKLLQEDKTKLGDSEITLEELLPAIESKICVS